MVRKTCYIIIRRQATENQGRILDIYHPLTKEVRKKCYIIIRGQAKDDKGTTTKEVKKVVLHNVQRQTKENKFCLLESEFLDPVDTINPCPAE